MTNEQVLAKIDEFLLDLTAKRKRGVVRESGYSIDILIDNLLEERHHYMAVAR